MSGEITQFDLQMPRDWLRKYCRHDRKLQACDDVCKTCGHRCGDHAHDGHASTEYVNNLEALKRARVERDLELSRAQGTLTD